MEVFRSMDPGARRTGTSFIMERESREPRPRQTTKVGKKGHAVPVLKIAAHCTHYTLTLLTNAFLFLPASEVVRLRYFGAPVEEDLEYFVIVFVCGEDERRHVRRVRGAHRVNGLPRVRRPRHVVLLLVVQENLHSLDVLLGDGQQQSVLHLR